MPLGLLGGLGLGAAGAGLAGSALGAFGVGADEGGPELAFFPSRSVNRYLTSLNKELYGKSARKAGVAEGTSRGDALVDTDTEFARRFGLANLGTAQQQLYGAQGQQGILGILRGLQGDAQGLINQDLASRGESLAKFREADPVLSALFGQAQEELASGGALDPGTRREVQQSTRSAQAARGLGAGTSDVYEELMNIGTAAEARRRRQQAFALSLLQSPADLAQYQAAATPASALQTGTQLYGLGVQSSQNLGPQLMQNPFGPTGIVNQPGSNPLAALGGGLMGTGGQLLGAGLANQAPRSNVGGGNNFLQSMQVPGAPANTIDTGWGLNTYME